MAFSIQEPMVSSSFRQGMTMETSGLSVRSSSGPTVVVSNEASASTSRSTKTPYLHENAEVGVTVLMHRGREAFSSSPD